MFPQLKAVATLLVAQAEPEASGAWPRADLFLPVVMMLILYFIWIRPATKERKTQQQMLESLKRGDEVVTNSGILGSIADISDAILTLQVDKNVKIRVLKSAIAKRIEEPKAKPEEKAQDAASKAQKS
ncbi:MAG: preprotein translocase subunit YajC [Deltaproteobacteria bacterium]|jgi:preprotein translocase subunit YajC|nr:preprotein translocase subunit YajC [Deltaproteobacteria bacterium]